MNQDDGNLEEIQEDEVLFDKTNGDPVTVATTSIASAQATDHNISVLNENILEVESKNLMLKDELIKSREI